MPGDGAPKKVDLDKLIQTGPPMCPVNSEVGPNQWLRIAVPTKDTTLTMGHQDLGEHPAYTPPAQASSPGGPWSGRGYAGIDDCFSKGNDLATLPNNNSLGNFYRLMLYVPTEHTRLSMGHEYPEYNHYNGFSLTTDAHFLSSAMGAKVEEQARRNNPPAETDGHGNDHGDGHGDGHGGHQRHAYTGFSVTTDGHIFTSVGGRMGIESRGDVILQSIDSSLYVGAPGSALFGSTKGMIIASPGGVVVHGGGLTGVSVPVADDRNAGTPNPPDAANQAGLLFDSLGSTWGTWDAIIAGLIVAKGLNSVRLNLRKNQRNISAAVVAGLGAIRDSFWTAVAVGGAGIAPTDPFGGTVVHGDKGVICATPGFGSVFAVCGFMVGSPLSVFVGAQKTELFGVVNACLESRKLLSLDSDDELEILAGEKLELSARKGDLRIDAERISAGAGAHGSAQQGTTALAIVGKDITIESKKSLHLGCDNSLTVAAPNVTMKGTSKAIFSAKTEAVMHVGKTQIHLQPGECAMGIAGKKQKVPKVPSVADGWADNGKEFYSFDPSKQKNYAKKLSEHVDKVKKLGSGRTQIHFMKKDVEFVVKGGVVADCKGTQWDFNKGAAQANT